MKKELFNQLVESIKEAGKIYRGELPPSRQFEVTAFNIKQMRLKLKKSQIERILRCSKQMSLDAKES